MRKIPYTYCLVKYLHDPAAGEMLNVGVLLCAPSISFIDARFNLFYERLSNAFAGFDGDHYREIITGIQFSVDKLRTRNLTPTLFVMDKEIQSVDEVVKKIMPDRGLGIQFGPTLAGLADNPSDELDHIFEQAVVAQYSKQTPDSRTDEDVWTVFRKSLSVKKIDRYLRPKNLLSAEGFDYKFDHAFKNEKWHVLKPVNMDYAQSATIQNKATKILGETMALEGNTELSTYYILLGEPRNDDHKAAYIKAKNLLHKKIPVKKEIYEEDAAKDLAEYLADYMEKHGVIQEPA